MPGKETGGKSRTIRETGKRSFALFVTKKSFIKSFAVGAHIQI